MFESYFICLDLYQTPCTTFSLVFRLGAEDSEEKSAKELLSATGKQMLKKKQLLLIPLTIWSGLEQGFFGADFTAVSRNPKV